MSNRSTGSNEEEAREDEVAMLNEDEAGEEVVQDEDVVMNSDDDEDNEETQQEIQLQNDSATYFDEHSDSIFCIAQHPTQPEIILTGGGDDRAFIFEAAIPDKPLLPASYASTPTERQGLKSLACFDGHSDSINAVAFTQPSGQYALTAGLDGRLRVWSGSPDGRTWTHLAEAREVEEINWLKASPHKEQANVFALGASDGSVWVYSIDSTNKEAPLTILQAFYLHTTSCTAGTWTADGKLLLTVSEDGSFYVWDVFGEAAAAGIPVPSGSSHVVGLTADDERFKVEGGLYSVAVTPGGALAAVGGAEGNIRIVSMPRILASGASATKGVTGAGSKSKAGGASLAGGPKDATGTKAGGGSAGQAGQLLKSLKAQEDSIESLCFAPNPNTLLASASVDGSIVLWDAARSFAIRRTIRDAHEGEAVIKVEFIKNDKVDAAKWLLSSCGNDGVMRRWDTRGGTGAEGDGQIHEWKGHRGGGEGGGILDFVQGTGEAIVTAGDDGVALLFEAPLQ